MFRFFQLLPSNNVTWNLSTYQISRLQLVLFTRVTHPPQRKKNNVNLHHLCALLCRYSHRSSLHCVFGNSSVCVLTHARDVGCRCRTVNYQIYKFIDIRLYLWRLAPYFSGVFSSELSPKSIFCIVTVGELLIAYFFYENLCFSLKRFFFLVTSVYSIPFTQSRFFFSQHKFLWLVQLTPDAAGLHFRNCTGKVYKNCAYLFHRLPSGVSLSKKLQDSRRSSVNCFRDVLLSSIVCSVTLCCLNRSRFVPSVSSSFTVPGYSRPTLAG